MEPWWSDRSPRKLPRCERVRHENRRRYDQTDYVCSAGKLGTVSVRLCTLFPGGIAAPVR